MEIKFIWATARLVLTQIVQHFLRRRRQRDRYRICLESTRNELTFYVEKLRQLLEEIGNLVVIVEHNGNLLIPTYSLYPSFLERSKIQLNRFFRNSELVRMIGLCHFQLCHVLLWLGLIKRQLRAYSRMANRDPASMEYDLQSFRKSVVDTVDIFEKTISDIKRELESLNY